MSAKKGIVIGLLIGLVVGCIGVTTTVIVYDSRIQDKQAKAFDEGREQGLKLATDQGVAIDISDKFNSGLMDENETLAQQISNVRTGLQALQSRDDMTPQAKDQVALILEGLK